MKIVTDHVSDIEQIMKFCSELTSIFGYPYYFNWSAPTNHRDVTRDGEIADIGYAIFRCGVYPQHEIVGCFSPVEKQIMFGPVPLIVNNFTPMTIMLGDRGIKITSMDDVKLHLDLLKEEIDKYLRDLVIAETNRGIDQYNAEYAIHDANEGLSPVPHIE